MNRTGVYQITNLINHKIYIGSSTRCLRKRWTDHKTEFRKGRHSRHFQSAWDKYGESSFIFEVIEECHPDECLRREQYYLDLYKPYDRMNGYNTAPIAGNCRGVKHGPEYSLAMSRRRKGVKHSEETKRKMREDRLGHERNGKPISQFTLLGVYIATYRSAPVAAKALFSDKIETRASNINACATGKKGHLHAYGFVWRRLPPSTTLNQPALCV